MSETSTLIRAISSAVLIPGTNTDYNYGMLRACGANVALQSRAMVTHQGKLVLMDLETGEWSTPDGLVTGKGVGLFLALRAPDPAPGAKRKPLDLSKALERTAAINEMRDRHPIAASLMDRQRMKKAVAKAWAKKRKAQP